MLRKICLNFALIASIVALVARSARGLYHLDHLQTTSGPNLIEKDDLSRNGMLSILTGSSFSWETATAYAKITSPLPLSVRKKEFEEHVKVSRAQSHMPTVEDVSFDHYLPKLSREYEHIHPGSLPHASQAPRPYKAKEASGFSTSLAGRRASEISIHKENPRMFSHIDQSKEDHRLKYDTKALQLLAPSTGPYLDNYGFALGSRSESTPEAESEIERSPFSFSVEPSFSSLFYVQPQKEKVFKKTPSSNPEPSRTVLLNATPSSLHTRSPSATPTSVTSNDKETYQRDPIPSPVTSPVHSKYRSLQVGQTATYRIWRGSTIYKGQRLVSNSAENEVDSVFLYKDHKDHFDGTVGDKTRKNGMRSPQNDTNDFLNGLKVSVSPGHKEGDHNSSSARPGISIHAFMNDPRSTDPGLIVAVSTSSNTRNSHEVKDLQVQIPILRRANVFFLVSVGVSAVPRDINISSSAIHLGFPTRISWNTAAMTAGQIHSSKVEPKTTMNFVYVLSSAPYTQHAELQGRGLDLSGLSDLSVHLNASYIDPFCNSRGTEIAAAIVGKNLGAVKHAIVVPLPVETCNTTASTETFRKALTWMHNHMVRNTGARFFVIVDVPEHPKNLLRPLSRIMKETSIKSAVVLSSASGCHGRDSSYLSVGLYGVGDSGRLHIPSMKESCVRNFDVFAPGLRVISAYTSGPYSYRYRSISTGIAAAGAVSTLINALQDKDMSFETTKWKTILRKELRRSLVFVGTVGNKSALLPLFGPGGSTELKKILESTIINSSGSVQSNDNKAASETAPSLPKSAVIGICVSAGLIAILLVVGGVLLSWRQSEDTSSSEGSSTSHGGPHDGGNAYDRTDKRPIVRKINAETLDGENGLTDATAGSVLPVTLYQKRSQEPQQLSEERPPPLLQNPVSLGQETSPQPTASEKASWFATPTGVQRENKYIFNSVGKHGFEEDLSATVVQINTSEDIAGMETP